MYNISDILAYFYALNMFTEIRRAGTWLVNEPG